MDSTFTVCKTDTQSTIFTIFSSNGGATWSKPVKVDSLCSFSQLSSPRAAYRNGVLEVTFLSANPFGGVVEITSGNSSGFLSPVPISTFLVGGDSGDIAGGLFEPSSVVIAVDQNHASSFRGNIYLAWQGGNQTTPDYFGASGSYYFNDILFSVSKDGKNFSTPIRVNDDNESKMATDQYHPGLTVDSRGNVQIAWYDRRNDPVHDIATDVYTARSTNGGVTFEPNRRVTPTSFVGVNLLNDIFSVPNVGDIVDVISDRLGIKPGTYVVDDFVSQGLHWDVESSLQGITCCQFAGPKCRALKSSPDIVDCTNEGGTATTGSCNPTTGKCE